MKNQIIVGVVLSMLAFLLYANTLGHEYNMDDDLVTINHPRTSQGFSDIPEIFTSYYFENTIGNQYEYRPVAHLSFAIEHQLFGESPFVSHLVNVLLYALTALLLFVTLRWLWPNYSILLPILVTAFFVAHPLHTEVVASIKNREEILAFIGGICALYFSLRYIQSSKWLWLLPYVLLVVFGVLSKRSVLPFLMLLPVILIWFHRVKNWQLVLLSIPVTVLVYLFSPNSNIGINVLFSGFVLVAPVSLNLFWNSVKLRSVWNDFNWKAKLAIIKKNILSGPSASEHNLDANGIVVNRLLIGLVILFILFSIYPVQHGRWTPAVLLMFVSGSLLFSLSGKYRYAGLILFHLWLLILAAITGNYNFVFIPIAPLVFELLQKQKLALPLALFMVVLGVPLFVLSKTIGYVPLEIFMITSLVALVIVLSKKVPAIIYILYVAAIINVVLIFQGRINETASWPILLGTLYYLSQHKKFICKGYNLIAGIMLPVVILFVLFKINAFALESGSDNVAANLPVNNSADFEQIDGIRQGTFVPGAGRVLSFVENPLVGETSESAKMATSTKVMGYYLYLMVYPADLNFYYGYDTISVVRLEDVWPALLLAIFILLPLLSIIKARQYPVITFGVFLFTTSLFAVSNFGVLVAGIVAERLAYIAVLGFAIIIAWALMKLLKVSLKSFDGYKKLSPILYVLVVVILIAMGTRTVTRNYDWKDRLTLFSTDVNSASRSAKALQLLGFEYFRLALLDPQIEQRYLKLAEQNYLRAIDVYPQFHNAIYNLGYLEAVKGDCKAALPWLKKAAEIEPFFPAGQFHYASCLGELGQLQDAAIHYEKCIVQDPYYEPAYANLSYTYYQLGQFDKSMQINEAAIRYFPNSPEPYLNIGKTYLTMNMPYKAMEFFERAYPLAPNDYNLVLTLADLHSQIGDPQKAAFYQQRAMELSR